MFLFWLSSWLFWPPQSWRVLLTRAICCLLKAGNKVKNKKSLENNTFLIDLVSLILCWTLLYMLLLFFEEGSFINDDRGVFHVFEIRESQFFFLTKFLFRPAKNLLFFLYLRQSFHVNTSKLALFDQSRYCAFHM